MGFNSGFKGLNVKHDELQHFVAWIYLRMSCNSRNKPRLFTGTTTTV
jgi:hypothetical protein